MFQFNIRKSNLNRFHIPNGLDKLKHHSYIYFFLLLFVCLLLLVSCKPNDQESTSEVKVETAVVSTEGSLELPENTSQQYEDVDPASIETSEPINPTPTPIRVQIDAGIEEVQEHLSGSPTNPLWGIEMHNMTKDGGLGVVSMVGTDWVRRNALLWSDIEPTEGARNWDNVWQLETEMGNVSNEGMELLLIVRRTPDWAQAVPGVYCGLMRDDKIQAFADFMYDVVLRYSYPPYNVKYWELGNEPDVDPGSVDPDSVYGCWGDQNDDYYGGGTYAEILKAVYPRVKQANPDAQLVIGGLLLDCDPINPPKISQDSDAKKDCRSSRYLEGILEAGGGDYFDGVSFHAYDYYLGELGHYGNPNWSSQWNLTGPVLTAKIKYLQFLLFQYGYPEKYLINSEVALICGETGEENYCNTEEFELSKATYAAQAYSAALSEDLQANVWYSTSGWRGSRILSPGLVPKPVMDAYEFNVSILKNSDYVGPIDIDSKATGYEFTKDGALIWVVWSLTGEEYSVEVPIEPEAVYDVFGALKPPSQEVVVSLEPIYIEMVP